MLRQYRPGVGNRLRSDVLERQLALLAQRTVAAGLGRLLPGMSTAVTGVFERRPTLKRWRAFTRSTAPPLADLVERME
jgi:hypothetical protein